MEQSLASHAGPSNSCTVSKHLIWFQIISQVLVCVDLTVRYVLRWKTRTQFSKSKDNLMLQFGWEDAVAVLALLPFTAYTGIFAYAVFDQNLDSTLFYASRIPLQCTLILTQLSQGLLWIHLYGEDRNPWVFSCMALISTLGLLSIGMVVYPPFAEIETYRSAVVTAAMVSNEISIMLVPLCFTGLAVMRRKGKALFIAWILPRPISAVVTATFGGFYLHTFWPQCSRQVVWCQQLNLLLSITILRGFGAISAIRQHITTKRSMRWMASTWRTDDRSASALILKSQPTQGQDLTPRDALETIPMNEDASDDGASTVPSTFPDNASTGINTLAANGKNVKKSLTQIAAQPIKESDSVFEAHLHSNAVDDETDEDETKMAQQWSQACQSERRSADAFTNISIFGAERKREHGVVQWWYLTKPHDIAIFSGYKDEPESAYGYVATRSPLKGGYQSIQFSPKWVRCREIREELRRQVWEKIGARFWSLTSSSDDVRWDGRKNQYQNLSTGSSVHLCGDKECERNSIVAQQNSMVIGGEQCREGTSTDICIRVSKVFTVQSEIATTPEQRVPQWWGKVEVDSMFL